MITARQARINTNPNCFATDYTDLHGSNAAGKSRDSRKLSHAPGCRGDRSPDTEKSFHHLCSFVVNELRQALSKGTLRAFRYADRFPTFKIFCWPVSLRRRVAPGQSRRSDCRGRSRWAVREIARGRRSRRGG